MADRRETILKDLEERLLEAERTTLADRTERMAELMALGEPADGRMIFGQAHDALFEAQSSYISGWYHCTIMAVQVCLEKLLSGQVGFFEMDTPPRSYARLLRFAHENRLLSQHEYDLFDRLRIARNPVAHHRPIDDPGHPLRRAMAADAPAEDLIFEDARASIRALIDFVNRPPFALGRLISEFTEEDLMPTVNPDQTSLLNEDSPDL